MNNQKILISLVVFTWIGGCATAATNTFDYQEHESSTVVNEAMIARPFEDVWNGLVRQLAKGYFVVNNIEKESRLINVSFSTPNPEQYIDCGETTRTFTQGKSKLTDTYEVAADSSYKYGNGVDPSGTMAIIGYVYRTTSLEGRINVYVAPKGEQTDVSVNVRYILSVIAAGQETQENAAGKIMASKPILANTTTISFNSNQPNKSANGISCFSKGVLERDILAMAQSQ